MQILHRSFAPADLVGGHPVLDFINTAPGRDASPRDWLDGYGRLLEWAALSGAFAPEVLEELRAFAEKSPAAAEAALGRARALRERLFKIFRALALGDEPPAEALDELKARWAEAAGWQLVWELPIDYAVSARTEIKGTFTAAVEAIAASMSTADTPMKVIFYDGNRVLRIVAR